MALEITLSVNVAESLRRGKPSPAATKISITDESVASLTPAQREGIADYLQPIEEKCNYKTVIVGQRFTLDVPEPTLAGMLEAVAREEARKAKESQLAKELEAATKQRKIDATWKVWNERLTKKCRHSVGVSWVNGEIVSGLQGSIVGKGEAMELVPDWPYDFDPVVKEDIESLPDYKTWLESLTTNEQAHQQARDIAMAELLDVKATHDARKAKQLEWIAQHGSARLKRLAKEGIEYAAVYRDERLAADRPGWEWEQSYADNGAKWDDARNCDEEALALLDQARLSDPDASLVYYMIPAIVDDDGDVAEESWSGIVAMSKFIDKDIVFGAPETHLTAK